MSARLLSRIPQRRVPVLRGLSRDARQTSTQLRWASGSLKDRQQSRDSGNLLIGLGWATLGLVAIDQFLQYRQEQEAKEHRRMLYSMQEEANQENQAKWTTDTPVIFQCKIIHTEPSLDGTKMLRNVGVGDVVEVLEAEIGPNKAYNLCRNPNSDRPGSVGWYPIQYMSRCN